MAVNWIRQGVFFLLVDLALFLAYLGIALSLPLARLLRRLRHTQGRIAAP